MSKVSKQYIYEFDEFWLDTAKLMLYRDRREIFLPPKVVETLLVLVEKRGEIVGKNELISEIWADSIVEESNLSQCLYRLRKTLGDRANGEPYIETFRRRGYRFNAEVRLRETLQIKNDSETKTLDLRSPDIQRQEKFSPSADWQKGKNLNTEVPDTDEVRVSAFFKRLLSSKAAIISSIVAIGLLSLFFYIQYKIFPVFGDSLKIAKSELTILRLTNGNTPQDATVSPDGNYFVYHESDGNIFHLWLQQTGGSKRIEIVPSSERIISGKTFTPDGGFVYFVAQNKLGELRSLYRVPTLGGTESKILDDITSPVSFSPDSKEMVFQRWNEKTRETFLIIATAEGRNERTLLSWAGGQAIVGSPAWSPDGNLIAFGMFKFRDSWQGNCTIVGLNLQTNTINTLSPERWDNCYRMIWTTDGQGLVFIGTRTGDSYSTRRDQVYYLSYPSGDTHRLTIDGSRHQIISLGVTNRDEIIAVPFNRSSQIWRMNSNGEARTAIQVTNGLVDGRAGLAPLADGRVGYIARIGDSLNIWLANSDGANQKQLTYETTAVEELRASPNGRFFVFSMVRDGRNHLFSIDTDGMNLRQLTFGDNYNIDSSVSPDGDWIVYDSVVPQERDLKHSLWKVSSSGGKADLLTDKNCAAPHFSPDGKFISCVYREREIIIISAVDGSTVKTFEPAKNSQLNFGARWSPNSEALVYIVDQNLWSQPINGDKASPLTDFTSGEIYNFAFSPDGLQLYLARGYSIRDAVMIKNFK